MFWADYGIVIKLDDYVWLDAVSGEHRLSCKSGIPTRLAPATLIEAGFSDTDKSQH